MLDGVYMNRTTTGLVQDIRPGQTLNKLFFGKTPFILRHREGLNFLSNKNVETVFSSVTYADLRFYFHVL